MTYDAATEMVRHAFVAQYGYSPDLVDNWLKFIIEEERERIIKILATMRDTTHEDAWDTLDDAIDAINGVSQNNNTTPFEYEGWN